MPVIRQVVPHVAVRLGRWFGGIGQQDVPLGDGLVRVANQCAAFDEAMQRVIVDQPLRVVGNGEVFIALEDQGHADRPSQVEFGGVIKSMGIAVQRLCREQNPDLFGVVFRTVDQDFPWQMPSLQFRFGCLLRGEVKRIRAIAGELKIRQSVFVNRKMFPLDRRLDAGVKGPAAPVNGRGVQRPGFGWKQQAGRCPKNTYLIAAQGNDIMLPNSGIAACHPGDALVNGNIRPGDKQYVAMFLLPGSLPYCSPRSLAGTATRGEASPGSQRPVAGLQCVPATHCA